MSPESAGGTAPREPQSYWGTAVLLPEPPALHCSYQMLSIESCLLKVFLQDSPVSLLLPGRAGDRSFCPLGVLVLPPLSSHALLSVGQLTWGLANPLKPFAAHWASPACLAWGKDHVPRGVQPLDQATTSSSL